MIAIDERSKDFCWDSAECRSDAIDNGINELLLRATEIAGHKLAYFQSVGTKNGRLDHNLVKQKLGKRLLLGWRVTDLSLRSADCCVHESKVVERSFQCRFLLRSDRLTAILMLSNLSSTQIADFDCLLADNGWLYRQEVSDLGVRLWYEQKSKQTE